MTLQKSKVFPSYRQGGVVDMVRVIGTRSAFALV